jgi:hypothetical protein
VSSNQPAENAETPCSTAASRLLQCKLRPNPAQKHVVTGYTPGLEYNSDGSLSIYMDTVQPPWRTECQLGADLLPSVQCVATHLWPCQRRLSTTSYSEPLGAAAVALGSLGGRAGGHKGGKARAANLTPEELSAIGRKGVAAKRAKAEERRRQKLADARGMDRIPDQDSSPDDGLIVPGRQVSGDDW